MLTELQAAALGYIIAQGDRGVRPAKLCWSLIDSGHITPAYGRRPGAQGAGFVGGKLISQLYRSGMVMSNLSGRGRGGGWTSTHAGRAAIAAQRKEG